MDWVAGGRERLLRGVEEGVDIANVVISRLSVRCITLGPSLLTFLFHSVFRTRGDIDEGVVDPQQRVTLYDLRLFIECLLERGCSFVSPADILAGLSPARLSALITFDDGYYNNHLVLPMLREYGIPAVFFIASNNVMENRAFWWDVAYREAMKSGRNGKEHRRLLRRLKAMPADMVESELLEMFGRQSIRPVGDTDRPFTPAELADFARDEHVFLGNHTADHAILVNYDRDGMRRQIVGCQRGIMEMTGISPLIISYPNGDYSERVLTVCGELGFRLGVTIEPRRNPLLFSHDGNAGLRLGRFVPFGGRKTPLQFPYRDSGRLVISTAFSALRMLGAEMEPRTNHHLLQL